MPAGHTLEELARRVGGRVRGNSALRVTGLRPLEEAGPADLSFLGNARYRRAAASSAAGALLTSERLAPGGSETLLLVADPYAALAEIVPLFHPPRADREGVSERAAVATDAQLGRGVFVGPFAVVGERCVVGDGVALHAGVVLGEECEVGKGSVLYPGVLVYARTRIGRRTIVHSGAVLGSDGFGFATVGGRHRKIPQVGRLIIGDDVEIGANVTIDRGSLGHTVIGSGSKIDNLVQIAHNVRLGENVLLVAQSGIAGSTSLGHGAVLAGQSGIAGHLRVGEGAVIASKSAVYDDIPDGAFVAGIPAREHRGWKKSQAALGRLPALRTEVREILRRLEKLERLSEGK